MAGCSNGKCRCMPGFKMNYDNYCEECRGSGECAANAQCIYDRQSQHYRCVCDAGYLGDGAIACISGAVANHTEAAQCRAPCHRFATCDEYDGRCKCRPGFIGNGYTYCDFDCSQCHAEAQCVPESNQCVCPPGFTGDGIRICRPVTSQGGLCRFNHTHVCFFSFALTRFMLGRPLHIANCEEQRNNPRARGLRNSHPPLCALG